MKIVEVAGTPSTEPQEVPGFDGTFPRPLADSGHTEKEWLAHKSEGAPLFHVRDIKPADLPMKDEGTAVEQAVEGSDA